jgi:hypothetical protein
MSQLPNTSHPAPVKFVRSARAPQRLLLILLGCVLATPSEAAVDCIERMSRIPMSSPSASVPSGHRANMLRVTPRAATAAPTKAAPHRRAKKRVVQKAKAHRSAGVARKAGGARRKAVVKTAAKPVRVRPPAVLPVSPEVAERDIARLRQFALIKTTICTATPEPLLIIAPPPVAPEPLTTLTPVVLEVPTPDVVDWPLAPPPELPLIVLRPGPPGPPSPPAIVTLTRPDAVPEPETWLLLILGFGFVGARLRTRRPAT